MFCVVFQHNLTGAFKQLYKLTNEHMNPGDHHPVDNKSLLGEHDNLGNEQGHQPPRPSVLDTELAGEGGDNNAGINGGNELPEDPIVEFEGKNVDAEHPRQRCRLNDN